MPQRTRPRNSGLRRDHRMRADLHIVAHMHQVIELHSLRDARVVQRPAIDRGVRPDLHVICNLRPAPPAEISSNALRQTHIRIRPPQSPLPRESPRDSRRALPRRTSLADESCSSLQSSSPRQSRNAPRSAYHRQRVHPRRSPRTAQYLRSPQSAPAARQSPRSDEFPAQRSAPAPSTPPQRFANATFGCACRKTVFPGNVHSVRRHHASRREAHRALACFAAST